MRKKRGLTLGKFAPLHKGHQLLIDTALSEMDEVVVIIYDSPETTSVPLVVRANWVRKLYPTVQVIEAWDGPTEFGNTPEIKSKHEDYILNQLKITGITHFYSSEFYGEHMSHALEAKNRIVDNERKTVPISAMEIRDNPSAFRDYMDPIVYRDLISNVVFLGAPCTGKTTIAARLAEEYETSWMPEYGREFWEKHNIKRRLSPEQLVEIAEGHLVREEALLRDANRFLFTDTNAITTYIFSLYYHNMAAPRLEELAAQASSRYDLAFLCDIDIPYHDTRDRSGELNREVFHKRILADLSQRKIPFFLLRGDLRARVRFVKGVLSRYHKYMNILGLFVSQGLEPSEDQSDPSSI